MGDENFLKAVNEEFEKVRQEHSEMHGSFQAVNDQHDEILAALKRVQMDHSEMNRELSEIKSLLKQLLDK